MRDSEAQQEQLAARQSRSGKTNNLPRPKSLQMRPVNPGCWLHCTATKLSRNFQLLTTHFHNGQSVSPLGPSRFPHECKLESPAVTAGQWCFPALQWKGKNQLLPLRMQSLEHLLTQHSKHTINTVPITKLYFHCRRVEITKFVHSVWLYTCVYMYIKIYFLSLYIHIYMHKTSKNIWNEQQR